LDDEDLDSGDDEGRNDRVMDDGTALDDVEKEEQQSRFIDTEMFKHPVPEPSDNEVCTLRRYETAFLICM
jgi:RNA polymerase-associated protein LEO1